MTNKLVVIINSLKVPRIKKILLYEMKFLVPNYSCLQNPWLEGYRPQIPVPSVLCPQLNLLNPPPKKKIPGYATNRHAHLSTEKCLAFWLSLSTCLFREVLKIFIKYYPSCRIVADKIRITDALMWRVTKCDAEFRDFYAPLTFMFVMKWRIVRRIRDLVMTPEGRRSLGYT